SCLLLGAFDVLVVSFCFFFNDTATPEFYTLSLHDALPISRGAEPDRVLQAGHALGRSSHRGGRDPGGGARGVRSAAHRPPRADRSEEHTSELQSRFDLVCRLLLEKKKKKQGQTDDRPLKHT